VEQLDVFMGQWKLLRTRMTVEEFDAAWVVLDAQLNQVMRNYFHKEWLPYRENFVHAWTKHVHKCHVALTGGPPLVPEDFCIQWRLTIRNNGEPLNRVAMQVMPPVKRKKRKVNGKRTASQARTKASTGRILSGFERLQGVLPPAAVEAPAPTTPPV
jgi:hypothetical protein